MVAERWQEHYQPVYPVYQFPQVSREEFEELRREIQGLKLALALATQIDKVSNQPDCEMAEKIDYIRKMAEWLGVDLEDVLDAA